MSVLFGGRNLNFYKPSRSADFRGTIIGGSGIRRAADENIPPTGNTLPLAGGSGSQARGGSIRATE